MENNQQASYNGIIYCVELKTIEKENAYSLLIHKISVNYKNRNLVKSKYCSKPFNIAQDHAVSDSVAETGSHSILMDVGGRLYAAVFIICGSGNRVKSLHIHAIYEEHLDLIYIFNVPNELKLTVIESMDGKVMLASGFLTLVGDLTIVIISRKIIYVHNLKNGIDKPTISAHTIKDVKTVWTSNIRRIVNGNYNMLICMCMSASNQIIGFVLCIKPNKLEISAVADLDIYFPQHYAPVIEHISMKLLPELHYTPDPTTREISTHCNTALLATSKKQIIFIENGKVKSCAVIPFSGVTAILPMVNSIGDEHIIVLGQDQNFCVLNNEKKIIKSSENGYHCFVDDFIRCGSEQLLALTNSPPESDVFILTDWAVYNIDTLKDVEADNHTDEDTNSMSMVIRALTSKLQRSVAELRKSEEQFQQKECFIQMTSDAIQSITARQSLNKTEPKHLVHLLGDNNHHCETKRPTMIKCTPNKAADDVIVVGQSWKRVVDEQWVIGTIVKNTSDRTMYDIAVTLTPEHRTSLFAEMEITSRSAAYLAYSTTSRSGEPVAAKKPRLQDMDTDPVPVVDEVKVENIEPGQTVYTVVTCGLPQFDASKCKQYSLNLSWRDVQEVAAVKLKKEPVIKAICHSKDIGSVSVSALDVLSGNYQCDLDSSSISNVEIRRNLISMLMIQQQTYLSIQSIYTNLQHHLRCALKQLGCIDLPSFNNQYVITRKSASADKVPLVGVRVGVGDVCSNKASISVYSRSDSQLLLFLHAMYHHLPDDIIMTPEKTDMKEEITNEAISSLQNETSQLRSSMKHLIKQAENQDATIKADVGFTLSSDGQPDLEKSRAEFKQLQGRVLSSKCNEVPGEALSNLVNKQMKLECETDNAVKRIGHIK